MPAILKRLFKAGPLPCWNRDRRPAITDDDQAFASQRVIAGLQSLLTLLHA
jgi:hypothetical protein